MKKAIKIPYSNREDYSDRLYEIFSLAVQNGHMVLAVNNNPYSLEAMALIEVYNNQDIANNVSNAINNSGMIFGFGNEITDEFEFLIGWKKYNFTKAMDKQPFLSIYDSMFQFASKKALGNKGYSSDRYFKP